MDGQISQAGTTLDQSRLRSEDSPMEGDKGCVDQHGKRGQVLPREIFQVSQAKQLAEEEAAHSTAAFNTLQSVEHGW